MFVCVIHAPRFTSADHSLGWSRALQPYCAKFRLPMEGAARAVPNRLQEQGQHPFCFQNHTEGSTGRMPGYTRRAGQWIISRYWRLDTLSAVGDM
jgi:hypothetical protein